MNTLYHICSFYRVTLKYPKTTAHLIMADFEIYIPTNLSFQDYIAIIQTARSWADGYDRKVPLDYFK